MGCIQRSGDTQRQELGCVPRDLQGPVPAVCRGLSPSLIGLSFSAQSGLKAGSHLLPLALGAWSCLSTRATHLPHAESRRPFQVCLDLMSMFDVFRSVSVMLCCAQLLCHIGLSVRQCTAAHQAPLSMEFPRQQHWSGLPFPSPKFRFS